MGCGMIQGNPPNPPGGWQRSRRKGSPRRQGPSPPLSPVTFGVWMSPCSELIPPEGKEVPPAAAMGTQLSSNELENSFPLILIILEGSYRECDFHSDEPRARPCSAAAARAGLSWDVGMFRSIPALAARRCLCFPTAVPRSSSSACLWKHLEPAGRGCCTPEAAFPPILPLPPHPASQSLLSHFILAPHPTSPTSAHFPTPPLPPQPGSPFHLPCLILAPHPTFPTPPWLLIPPLPPQPSSQL